MAELSEGDLCCKVADKLGEKWITLSGEIITVDRWIAYLTGVDDDKYDVPQM